MQKISHTHVKIYVGYRNSLAYPIESRDAFMGVDFHQSVHHSLVLPLICVILQDEASFGHPDRVGQTKRHGT